MGISGSLGGGCFTDDFWHSAPEQRCISLALSQLDLYMFQEVFSEPQIHGTLQTRYDLAVAMANAAVEEFAWFRSFICKRVDACTERNSPLPLWSFTNTSTAVREWVFPSKHGPFSRDRTLCIIAIVPCKCRNEVERSPDFSQWKFVFGRVRAEPMVCGVKVFPQASGLPDYAVLNVNVRVKSSWFGSCAV